MAISQFPSFGGFGVVPCRFEVPSKLIDLKRGNLRKPIHLKACDTEYLREFMGPT